MNEIKKDIISNENKVIPFEKPVAIFKTEQDKYSRSIECMSDFFDDYIKDCSLSLKEGAICDFSQNFSIANIGIIADVIHHADVVMKGETILVPDFDSLPSDILKKLKKGIYKIAESKQVEGNARAVIYDENDVRIKDITLKRVANNPGTIETVRNISNQIQMKQMHNMLAEIQNFQMYQLEKDRDNAIIVPFLDARSMILEAEAVSTLEERNRLLRGADDKMRTATSALYSDIETTAKYLVKCVDSRFIPREKQAEQYMHFITKDLQIATKYVGIRLQLQEHLGEEGKVKEVLLPYQMVMKDFLTKPVGRRKLPLVSILQENYPYDKSNMNCWFKLAKEMEPVVENSIKMLNGDDIEQNIYLVNMEDVEYDAVAELKE